MLRVRPWSWRTGCTGRCFHSRRRPVRPSVVPSRCRSRVEPSRRGAVGPRCRCRLCPSSAQSWDKPDRSPNDRHRCVSHKRHKRRGDHGRKDGRDAEGGRVTGVVKARPKVKQIATGLQTSVSYFAGGGLAFRQWIRDIRRESSVCRQHQCPVVEPGHPACRRRFAVVGPCIQREKQRALHRRGIQRVPELLARPSVRCVAGAMLHAGHKIIAGERRITKVGAAIRLGVQ